MSAVVEPTRDSQVFRVGRGARREPVVPSGILAMAVFVVCEIMFFGGLISAYLIAKGAATNGWPPPGQPRLPIEETAVNSLALLASGVLLYLAGRAFLSDTRRARRLLLVSMLLGTAFVGFQGAEWLALIREGLTITTSQHGSFFYLIIGLHALHAVAALASLVWVYGRMRKEALTRTALSAAQIFWYFVVLIWPILYWQVYLS